MNKNEFDENGNRPNDLSDGFAITAVMMIIIASIIYYLYSN